MTDYGYGPFVAYDPTTNTLVTNGAGQVYALTDTAFATPLSATDLTGTPVSIVPSSGIGVIDEFVVADQPEVNWKSGAYVIRLSSIKGLYDLALSASTAAASALATAEQTAQDLADSPSVLPDGGQAGIDVLYRGSAPNTGVWAPPPTGTGGSGTGGLVLWDSIPDKPTTFPPSPHTHPVGQISDASAVGKAVVTAASQQAARAAIGAGTGNGTSDLQLGSTGTTAAPGNHSHAASAIAFVPVGSVTATDVQTAIAQAAQSGGVGSGTSQVQVWEYASGAYPALPATQPAGIRVLWALGPTFPTSVPSWVGLGAGKVRLKYEYLALT